MSKTSRSDAVLTRSWGWVRGGLMWTHPDHANQRSPVIIHGHKLGAGSALVPDIDFNNGPPRQGRRVE